MKTFFAAVFFMFVLPFLFYKAALLWAVPFFGIAAHQSMAAIGFMAIPTLISLLIGFWCAKGAPMPDN